MGGLTVDLTQISGDGRAIQVLAQGMPDPNWGPHCDCGSDAVTGLLDRIISEVNHNLLGAATEMYSLGRGISDAARAVADADARLAAI